MLFPTVAFAAFFCIAFLANWLLRPHHRVWRIAMTGLSLVFYGWWDYRFVGLLALTIVINYWSGRAIFRCSPGNGPTVLARAVLVAGISANLAVLGIFKYYGFFVTSATNIVAGTPLAVSPPILELALPIGISFYTFQAISYIVDLHNNSLKRPMSFLDFAFYLSFFPQLVAGPIVRATEMIDQITRRPDPRSIPATEAFWMITQGLFKKVVVSSYLASNVVDPVFEVPGNFSRLEIMAALYGYSIQIYADFSGYTDMAIGCALLLGFRFPQNFDSPYRALSVGGFWRRWHMSLSRWLRDYLYLPLGGNRGGRWRTYRNLMITMLLGGLWHGADTTFIAWGAVHGLAMAGERALGQWWKPLGLSTTAVSFVRWFATFHIVTFSWVLFRADSFNHAFDIFQGLFAGFEPSELADHTTTVAILAYLLIATSLTAHFVHPTALRWFRWELSRWNPGFQIAALAIVLTTADALGPQGVAPFIYFQF